MSMNYLSLVNRCLLQAKRTPVTSISSTVNSDAYRAQLAVNDTVQDMAHLLRIRSRMITFEFSTVAAQRTYVINKRMMFPFYTLRQKVTDLILAPANTRDVDRIATDDQSSGNPSNYYLEEFTSVDNQPASAGEKISSVSSSSADASVVVLQGYDTSDNYVTEEVTLTGTTAVASSNTYKKISMISKGVTTGSITFRNAGSTTTYQTLSPQETFASQPVIGLNPIPSSVMTIYGRGWMTIPDLVHENSIPMGLNEQHLNALVRGSMARFMEYDPKYGDESVAGYYQRYYDEIQKITTFDQKDGVTYRMQSPYMSGSVQTRFRPLSRRSI